MFFKNKGNKLGLSWAKLSLSWGLTIETNNFALEKKVILCLERSS